MPRFPAQFNAATSVALTDYVFLNNKKATVAQLGAALGTQPSFAWDGSSVAQFGSVQNIGTPTAPTLTVSTQTTQPTDALRVKLGNGTGAGEGAAWWSTTALDAQPIRVRFVVGIDAATPIGVGENINVGFIVAGSQATGNGIYIAINIDDAGAGTLTASAWSDYATIDQVFVGPVSIDGAYAWSIDATLNIALRDAVTYAPNGAPALLGTIQTAGLTTVGGNAALANLITTDWAVGVGAEDTDGIGVVITTNSGLTADAAALIYSFEVSVI